MDSNNFYQRGTKQKGEKQKGGHHTNDITYSDEFEVKREMLRKSEIKDNPIRFRLLAYSLSQFTPLKKNKYLERKRYQLTDREANSLVCTCERATVKKNDCNSHQSFNCGDQCLNRCVSAECCPWTCPCGPFCKNRRFQLHQDAYVFPFKTEYKGWGLLAGELIKKGQFIMQYVGEVFSVDSQLGEERVKKYKNSTCTYLMKTTNNEVIDPTNYGNIARFINHSCDPNCVTQKWNVLGEVCVGIFAVRDIKENEELTFDYQFDFFKTPFTKCYCGTSKCKGYLGVLATTNAGSDNQLNQSSITAPECGYCKKLILEKDSLIVCKGANKETYHIACVIKREGGKTKQRVQNFSQALDVKQFTCKVCRIQEKQRLKDELGNTGHSDCEDSDTPEDDSPFPLASLDPQVRRVYDPTDENRTLDEIIVKELDLIEKEMEDLRRLGLKSRIFKLNLEFSPHYNFMSELQKKLKSRIRRVKGNVKFRRPKEMVVGRGKRRRAQAKKLEGQPTDAVVAVPKKRTRAPRTKKPVAPAAPEDMDLQVDIECEEKLADEPMTDIHQDNESNEESPESEVEEESEEDESSESQEDEEEEAEQEEIEDIPIDESSLEEQEEEEEEELNLDELQASEEESQGEASSSSSSEEEEEEIQIRPQRSTQQRPQRSRQVRVARNTTAERPQRGGYRGRRQRVIMDEESDTEIQKINSAAKYQTPRKNSLISRNHALQEQVNQSQSEKLRIQHLVQQKVEAFVKEQNILFDGQLEDFTETKESKFNMYETVFNLAVPEFIDDFQCLPNFQIYWDQAWGGMVTIRIISTFKQYNFFTSMLQQVTDLMFKSNLLSGKTHDQHPLLSSEHEPPIQYPFEILIISVPKNYLRKLVGYHEKNLEAYQKQYIVDFDYSRDLLNDDVYPMNEVTPLRVFGATSHARAVNQLIQQALETLKLKTIFLQMSDCKIIMDHVKEVKVQVDPCEIRIKKSYFYGQARDWKELRHPFFYLPNYFREMVLIGTTKEIDEAEIILEKFLTIKRQIQKINMQQISYLLPISFKAFHMTIKQELLRRFQHLQVFFYDPTFPRKHITCLMIGDWKLLLEAKKVLEVEVNKSMYGTLDKSFDTFQRFTYHQQIRFSFKSLKRFVLERDIKYLGHWDMVSEFVENAGLRRWKKVAPMIQNKVQTPAELEEQRRRDAETEIDLQCFIKYIKEDDIETCINTLFVLTDSKPEILEKLMKSLQVQKKELILMMAQVLRINYQVYKDTMAFTKPGGSFQQPFYQGGGGAYPFYKSHYDPPPVAQLPPPPTPSIIQEQALQQQKKSRSPSHQSQAYRSYYHSSKGVSSYQQPKQYNSKDFEYSRHSNSREHKDRYPGDTTFYQHRSSKDEYHRKPPQYSSHSRSASAGRRFKQSSPESRPTKGSSQMQKDYWQERAQPSQQAPPPQQFPSPPQFDRPPEQVFGQSQVTQVSQFSISNKQALPQQSYQAYKEPEYYQERQSDQFRSKHDYPSERGRHSPRHSRSQSRSKRFTNYRSSQYGGASSPHHHYNHYERRSRSRHRKSRSRSDHRNAPYYSSSRHHERDRSRHHHHKRSKSRSGGYRHQYSSSYHAGGSDYHHQQRHHESSSHHNYYERPSHIRSPARGQDDAFIQRQSYTERHSSKDRMMPTMQQPPQPKYSNFSSHPHSSYSSQGGGGSNQFFQHARQPYGMQPNQMDPSYASQDHWRATNDQASSKNQQQPGNTFMS